MHRLYVPPGQLTSPRLELTPEQARYLGTVLRLKPGEELEVFDGKGARFRAWLEDAPGLEAAALRLAEPLPDGPPRAVEVVLVQALAKGERMELVVQKATELGASRIVPMRTARSIGPAEVTRQAARRQRWIKIAREAARQCGRADVPDVAAPVDLDAALAAAPQDALRLLFWEEARGVRLRDRMPAERPARIVVAVGPEGGFEAGEVERARAAGFEVVGLGPRTLRAETAALAALVVVGFALGDLG